MKRIVIVGAPGSGKTSLAKHLSRLLDARHIELDALHWEPGWQEALVEDFRARVQTAVQSLRWVADGNYSKVRDIVWTHADTLVWLDYRLWVVWWRLIRRTIRRIVTREELWNGNRERWWAPFSRQSLFWWALKSQRRHRVSYPRLWQQPEFAHLHVIRHRSPAATRQWLSDATGIVC